MADSRRIAASRPPSLRAAEEALPQYGPRLQLGAGSFGRVFLMEHRETHARVAVKTLKKERIVELGMEEKVRREIDILLRLKHPNIIRLYDVRETPRYIVLVMEYAQNGELFEYITERGRLSEGEARRIFQQMIAGLECCHRRMVAHRDLKPENILLDAHWTVKIADFGLGNIMREGHFLTTSCGSPNYAAPEVICGRPYCGPEVDLWGCGVVLYTLLCGRLPFDEKSHAALYQKIKVAAYPRPAHASPAAQDLLARLLVVDPTLRATIPEVRRHPWFLPWFIPQDIIQLRGTDLAEGEAVSSSSAQQASPSERRDDRADGVRGMSSPEEGTSPAGPVGDREGGCMSGGRAEQWGVTPWSEDGQLQHRIWGQARWDPGITVEASGQEAMQRVLSALKSLRVSWKRLGPYSLKCRRPWQREANLRVLIGRQRGAVRKRPAREADIDLHSPMRRVEGLSVDNGSSELEGVRDEESSTASAAADLRFEVQLYRGEGRKCIIDFCFLWGLSPLVVFDFCTEFQSTILKANVLLP